MTDSRMRPRPVLRGRMYALRGRLARRRRDDGRESVEAAPPTEITVVEEPSPVTLTQVFSDLLPRPILVLAAWALVVIVTAGAGTILVEALGAISMVVIPVAVAVLLAALLHPAARFLSRIGLHRVIAALLTVVVPTALVVVGVVLAGSQIAAGAAQLATNAQAGVDSILLWLRTGPLHITSNQLNDYLDSVADVFRSDTSTWSSGAVTAGIAVIDIVAGLLICLISTFFFLLDGEHIWQFCVRFVPRGVRAQVHEAGRRGWVSLGAYSHAQIAVAAADAIGIAAGAAILGLPLVLPIFVLVFVCAFVPILGTVVAGVVPTLIAFVAQGPFTAAVMLGIVLVVQQVEAHVLQPFLMGKAVDLHPLAVIIAVAAATYLYGIAGALFAVPVLAFVNSAVRYLGGEDPFPELGRQPLPRE